MNLRLAVIYLIGKQKDVRFAPLLERFTNDANQKIKDFALRSLEEISPS